MMTPVYNFVIEENCDFTKAFLYTDPITNLPVNLTGYTASLTLRQNYEGTYSVPADFTFTSTLTTAGSGIVLNTQTSLVTVTIKWVDISTVTFDMAKFNLLLTDSTGVTTEFLKGLVTFLPQ